MVSYAHKIWPNESANYNRPSLVAGPEFLSLAERQRMARVNDARRLFDGDHEDYFLNEGRGRFTYRRVRTAGGERPLYIATNLLKLISTKAADLLFGQAPVCGSDSSAHQDAIERLMDRSQVHQILYQGAIDASTEKDAYLEAIVFDNEVYIQTVDGAEIWPVGRIMPDGQYKSYIRRNVQNVGTDKAPAWLMLETTYRASEIERHVYQLTADGQRKGSEANLDEWPEFKGNPIAKIQKTGIPWNTIVWVPNFVIRREPLSDYDGGIIGLQDVVNAKTSQLALVILKHAQPKLLVPEQLFDDQGKLPDQEVYITRPGEPDAKYLTWEAQLDAAQKDRSFHINQLLIQSETSPVLLGMKEGAAPDAYKKVRLESFNSLTKSARRAIYWGNATRTILQVAAMLDQTVTGRRYDIGTISVELADGIPVDEFDQANTLSTLKTADIVDDEWCLEQLVKDPAAVQKILARLQRRRSEQAPTFIFGEPGAPAAPRGAEGKDDAEIADHAQAPGPAVGAEEAGVSTDLTLNGAQITAALDVIAKRRAGELAATVAVELLVAVGIKRENAVDMVAATVVQRTSNTGGRSAGEDS